MPGYASREQRPSRSNSVATDSKPEHDVPDSGGLKLHIAERPIPTEGLGGEIEPGTRAVSVFLVNDRSLADDPKDADETYAFQAAFSVECDLPVPPTPRPLRATCAELGRTGCSPALRGHAGVSPTGHGVSADWTIDKGECRQVCTTWVGSAEVEATKPNPVRDVELSMRRLGDLPDGTAAEQALLPMVSEYRRWIESHAEAAASLPEPHRDVAQGLLQQARHASDRMERGVGVLVADPDALGCLPGGQPGR